MAKPNEKGLAAPTLEVSVLVTPVDAALDVANEKLGSFVVPVEDSSFVLSVLPQLKPTLGFGSPCPNSLGVSFPCPSEKPGALLSVFESADFGDPS